MTFYAAVQYVSLQGFIDFADVCNFSAVNKLAKLWAIECMANKKLLSNVRPKKRRRITDANLALIRKMKSSDLNLTYCNKITDVGLMHFVGSHLTSLNLSETNLTDAGLKHIKGLSLVKITISGLNITDVGLTEFIYNNPSLTDLDISWCKQLTDVGFAHIEHLSLIKLSMRYLGITDNGLSALKNSHLTKLDISFCNKITDAGLAHINKLSLNELKICGTKITNNGLASFKESPLAKLDISYCNHITDAGFAHLEKISLVELKVSDTNITDEGLNTLKESQLTLLDITHCEHITDAGLKNFTNSLTNLIIRYCPLVTDTIFAYLTETPLHYFRICRSYSQTAPPLNYKEFQKMIETKFSDQKYDLLGGVDSILFKILD